MKNDRSIYLSVPDVLNIEIKGEFECQPGEIETLAQAYLPGVIIGRKMLHPDVVISFKQSLEKRIAADGKNYIIFDDWKGKLSLDVWHFAYSILRICLLEHQLYPVHAACVGKKKHVLLVGHSGSGKSNVLLKLINDYDWTAFSGNKTVISLENNTVRAVMGTLSMSLWERDLSKFPNIESKKINYQSRAAFELDDRHYSPEKIEYISTIYLVKLNDGVSEIEELFYPSSSHVLYPYFMDFVNADTILCDGNDIFLGTPPNGCQQMLVRKLKTALTKVRVIKISGSLEFITKNIASE